MSLLGTLQIQLTTERNDGEMRSRIVEVPINCVPTANKTLAVSADMTDVQCALAHLEAEQQDNPESITGVWVEVIP